VIAESIEASLPSVPGAAARPVYFRSGADQLFGWLHLPHSRHSAMGLVICKPFGFEAMSAHIAMRLHAESAAEIGIPTLRFDYRGTGDSEDLEPNANQIDAWVEDIVAAVEELQQRTGVTRVCLLGIRLGALLAALAAARRPQHVHALIALAPVISGRRYLRELRTFELAAAQTQAAIAASSAPVKSFEAELAGPGHLEVSGFFLNAKSIDSLQQTDLLTLPAPAVEEALVIDPSDLPGAVRWRESLSAAGILTDYAALPGFVGMIMRPPNLTVIPQAIIAKVCDWLSRAHTAQGERREAADCPSRSAATVMSLRHAGANLTEVPVMFGASSSLFAIITRPPAGELRHRGVIFLNSGGDHHIGPRRFYVLLAREWAEHGYVVCRMDLSGLGDSAPQPGRPLNEVFPIGAVEDIRAAVNTLRSQFGVQDVTLAGMCSGASHAVRAGMEGVAVNRVLAINPLVFFWRDDINASDVQPWEVAHKPAVYLGQIWSAAAWRRLLFGDVSIWRVAQIYLHRPMMSVQSRLRKVARYLHIRLKNDLYWGLKHLKARGVRVVFAFSRGDAGMRLLQLESGLSAEQLAERFNVRIIDGADHEFTRSNARSALREALSEELYARNAGSEAG